MNATPIARNTRTHEKHPRQKKKSTIQSQETDDNATAVSIAGCGFDCLKSKHAASLLVFPTTNRPISAPSHANDYVVK